MHAPITFRDYYELNPSLENSPGDIWHGLPTFGLLPFPNAAGLVVTPACDLANRKAETITFLPVIPVLDWFRTPAFLPELRRTIDSQWKLANSEALFDWPTGFRLPEVGAITAAVGIVKAEHERDAISKKLKTAMERVLVGLSLLRNLATGSPDQVELSALTTLLGSSTLTKSLEDITINSYRADIHFLLADNQPNDWSGTPVHSVTLFRYPITAPIDVFDAAQDISLRDWRAFLGSIENTYASATAFVARRPVKLSRVKVPFISDLIARYIGLNMRLGSPDFTEQTVSTFVAEITQSTRSVI